MTTNVINLGWGIRTFRIFYIHFKTTKLSLVGLLGNLCEIAFVHVSRRWENEISYTKLGLCFIFSREKNRTTPIRIPKSVKVMTTCKNWKSYAATGPTGNLRNKWIQDEFNYFWFFNFGPKIDIVLLFSLPILETALVQLVFSQGSPSLAEDSPRGPLVWPRILPGVL